MSATVESPFKVQRLGVVMRPDPALESEIEGVLNPGAVRGRDGALYLFPRLVGRNNYSRIGIARVLFDPEGIPTGVERLGIALEPTEPYELRPSEGTGGCEDPRVTFVEPLGLYVMAYVAWGPNGPRIALAISETLLEWERLGVVDFQPDVEAKYGVIFNNYHNKDAAFFPNAIPLRDGTMVLGMLHRPFYDSPSTAPKGVKEALPSIWVSGCELEWAMRDVKNLRVMRKHALLIDPDHPWEQLRVGVGTPPAQTPLGYFMVYHGVSGEIARVPGERNRVQYVAGVLVLRREDDKLLEYRSSSPVLIPELGEETQGTVDNVVFPTGIDDRGDGVLDVYYGMADRYIGAVRMWLPKTLDYQARNMVEVERLRRLEVT
jgi:beta-1,2-mannobiose phosphorylase / 1,2-beta-oligomannan phosphorylase